MRAVGALVGVVLVVGILLDAVSTLISTRQRVGRFWPTERLHRVLWSAWRRVARRMHDDDRRDAVLAAFAPVAVLGTLVAYLMVLLVGWALIWWAFPAGEVDQYHFGDALYFSGTVLFTIGFGDLTPADTFSRMLSIAEAFTGIGMLTLVLGYLPTLYSAYSAREVQILMLDDTAHRAIGPADFIVAVAGEGERELLYGELRDWERWTARLLESHSSYPMLTWFRSQHRGQSWVSALGVVTDAAALVLTTMADTRRREASLLYRRSVRTVEVLAGRLRVPSLDDRHALATFEASYDRLAEHLEVAPREQARREFLELRAQYGPALAGLRSYTLAPSGFLAHAVETPPAATIVDEG